MYFKHVVSLECFAVWLSQFGAGCSSSQCVTRMYVVKIIFSPLLSSDVLSPPPLKLLLEDRKFVKSKKRGHIPWVKKVSYAQTKIAIKLAEKWF